MANTDILSASTNIQIFPTTKRPIYDPLGKLTTEYNLTSLLNKLLDVEGFVITNSDNAIVDGEFEFNIYGYIIKVHNIEDIINNANNKSIDNIYAHIQIQTANLNTPINANTTETFKYNLSHIWGEDNEGIYSGVKFTSTPDNPWGSSQVGDHKYLHILEKNSNIWYIPGDSKIKFKTSDNGKYRSVSIDDGVLG